MSDDATMWQEAHARAVAEIARLRSVCREAAGVVKAATSLVGDRKYVCGALNDVAKDLADAGKETSDGL